MERTIRRVQWLHSPKLTSRLVIAMAAALLLAVANTALTAPANAYTTTGCKWPSANISYYNAAGGVYSSPATLAANSWTNITDVNLSPLSGSNWTLTTQNNGNNGLDGKAWWLCTGGVTGSGESWLNTYNAASLSATAKRAVYSHEIGHVLGLSHSGSLAANMYSCPACAYSSNGIYYPATDDAAGANALY